MANHASHGRLPYPIRNARYTILIPYLDADGDPTDPTTPDTEISKDDGAAADTAEEVATPKNSIGMLTLTGAETDCSLIGLAAKAASGPKTTLFTLYPRDLPVLESGTAQAGASTSITLASSAPSFDITGCYIRTTGGTGGGGTGGANNQARRITAYNTGTKVATVAPAWETSPDATTTYDILCPEGVTPGMLKALNPATPGRTIAVEADGMAHADVKEWLGAAPLALSSQKVQAVDSLAAQASVCTEARLSELDAGTAGKMANQVDVIEADTTAALDATVSSRATPAQVRNEAAGALIDVNLDHLVGTAAPGDAPANTYLDRIMDDGTATYDRTTDSLQAIGDRATEARLSELDAGTAGKAAAEIDIIKTDVASILAAVVTEVADILAAVDTEVAAIKAKTDQLTFTGGNLHARIEAILAGVIAAASFDAGAINSTVLGSSAADEIANALLDLANGVETGFTLRQALRLLLAALAGKLSGAATTTIAIRDVNDTKTRITGTVDADGNRSAVIYDTT